MPISKFMEMEVEPRQNGLRNEQGWVRSAREGVGLPYWFLGWLWVVLVAYGTLVPFEALEPSRLGEGLYGLSWWWAWLNSPKWVAGPADDWVTNLILYAPVGMLLRLHLWQRGENLVLQFRLPLLWVVLMPWLLECVQSLMPYRVASLNDWLVNAGGGVAGVWVAVGVRTFLRDFLVHGWWGMVPTFEGIYWRLLKMRKGWFYRGVMVMLHVGLVMMWWRGSMERDRSPTINWMPFSHHFDLPYMDAAWIAGQAMGFYLLIAMMLSLQYLVLSRKRHLLGMLMWLVGLSMVREWLMGARWSRFDVTEPILAMSAGLLVLGILVGGAHAVVRACRRGDSEPVEVERRTTRFTKT